MHPTAHSQALLTRLFDEIDYQALGPVYCDEGGEAFWDAHRESVLESGKHWAAACSKRISPDGVSLYVGAGVAELGVLVTEVCDLGRRVHVTNLDQVECGSLNATLAGVGLSDRICFQCVDAAELLTSDPALTYDHLSVVSVLNDPVLYPNVSGVAYGRVAPVLLDVPAFENERDKLRGLASILLAGLSLPGTITTTVEEVSWFLAAGADHDLAIEADDEMVPTALVGDPLGFLRVTRAEGST